MRIVYEITREDYDEACAVHGAQAGNRSDIWTGTMIMATGFFLLLKQEELPPWLAPAVVIVLSVGLLVVPIRNRYAAVERGWKAFASDRTAQPISLTMDEQGIHKSSVHWSSHVQWSAFALFRETRGLLLLYYDDAGRDVAELVPKRAFASEADAAGAAEMIRAKLQRVRGAFEVIPPKNPGATVPSAEKEP